MEAQNNTFTFSRRNFIRTSALAGGGLLIGFNILQACKQEVAPPVDIANLNFNDFNAFIKIADNGMVTIFSPNPEIGQGVKTAMPMIIAEELDVPWDHVHVAQGILDTKNYQRQVAGGSQSIRFGWDALRQTGATTRQMLINAAAAKWSVDASTCTAADGVITNANGDTLGYGDVVKEAARIIRLLVRISAMWILIRSEPENPCTVWIIRQKGCNMLRYYVHRLLVRNLILMMTVVLERSMVFTM